MKRIVITNVITAIVTALVIIGGYFGYTKIINKADNINNEIIEKNENNSENVENQMSENTENISLEKWSELTSVFYGKNYGFRPQKVICTALAEYKIQVVILNDDEFIDELELDPRTGIAISKTAKNINLLTGKFDDEVLSKVKFEREECLAIGYIAKGKGNQIKDTYFNNQEEYEFLTTVKVGDMYNFIVIPKSREATLKVYTYERTIEGELVFDELLTEAKGTPLLIKSGEFEVVPNVGIVYECGDVKFTIPLITSGKDGTIIKGDYENYIKDISIYE